MKRNAIVRIILNSFLALALTGVLVSGIITNGFIFISGDNNGTLIEGEASFDSGKVRKLEIDWAAGSVIIRAADTDTITVSETMPEGCKYTMVHKVSGDTLSLDFSKDTIALGFGRDIPSKDLLITVPRNWVCEDLEIDGASLSIEILDLNADSISLDGASCSLDFSGSVDQVEIDGASCDIRISSFNPVSSIQIDGASCDLDLILPKECGFLVQMNGLSCHFHSDLGGISANNTYSYGDQRCKVEVNGLSCDVTIEENQVWPIAQ